MQTECYFESIVGPIPGNILVEFYMLWYACLDFLRFLEIIWFPILIACSIWNLNLKHKPNR